MSDVVKDFLRKLLYALLTGLGSFLLKYFADIKDEMNRTNIQLAQLTQLIGAHERQLQTLENYNQIIFRVESALGQHEKRIDMMEMKANK